jgi:hypothetical protein
MLKRQLTNKIAHKLSEIVPFTEVITPDFRKARSILNQFWSDIEIDWTYSFCVRLHPSELMGLPSYKCVSQISIPLPYMLTKAQGSKI